MVEACDVGTVGAQGVGSGKRETEGKEGRHLAAVQLCAATQLHEVVLAWIHYLYWNTIFSNTWHSNILLQVLTEVPSLLEAILLFYVVWIQRPFPFLLQAGVLGSSWPCLADGKSRSVRVLSEGQQRMKGEEQMVLHHSSCGVKLLNFSWIQFEKRRRRR